MPNIAFPNYSDMNSRLNSFQGWPNTSTDQPALSLAKAGFFYIGSADRVQCFHCGVRLRNWDREDDPSSCHRLYSPDCPFISQGELEVFYRQQADDKNMPDSHGMTAPIAEEVPADAPEPEIINSEDVLHDLTAAAVDSDGVDDVIDWQSAKMLALLENGIRKRDIAKFVRDHLNREFPTAVALMAAMMDE
ncbi:death-associated inhibitor of apoptosis 2-like [Gigantopelta aegis]|uniref:death-associated inhibitor of apoptosis 2-like n=1 Tax=Gigantopelta aegis TaxID=1735272 RepID=UPI001B887AD0|nr:death-associated inhibitor of apoptosis 2-like [Gigantopelta aegis]